MTGKSRRTDPRFKYGYMKDGTQTRYQWRERWFSNEPGLRERYGNDREAYLRAYPMNELATKWYQWVGMEAFRELVEQETRLTRTRRYETGASEALESLVAALSSENPTLTPESDFIIASIDFEGSTDGYRGITGFGTAKLDTRQLFLPGPTEIQCSNYRFRSKGNNGFLFGMTLRDTPDRLAAIVRENLTVHCQNDGSDPSPARKVVLVAHSIFEDIDRMDHSGLRIEDLPGVIGLVDTYDVAHQALGKICGLWRLLTRLNIPQEGGALHCAGNDAYYTLKALLAMLQMRHVARSPSMPRIQCLDELVRHEGPPAEERARERAEERVRLQEESEESMSCLAGMFS